MPVYDDSCCKYLSCKSKLNHFILFLYSCFHLFANIWDLKIALLPSYFILNANLITLFNLEGYINCCSKRQFMMILVAFISSFYCLFLYLSTWRLKIALKQVILNVHVITLFNLFIHLSIHLSMRDFKISLK